MSTCTDSIEIEGVLIGMALAYPDRLARFDIGTDEFSDPIYRACWASIRAALAEGLSVDVFLIAERTPSASLGDLGRLQSTARSADNLDHYLDLFHRAARSRETRAIAAMGIDALDQGKNADRVRGRMLARLADIGSENQESVLSIADILRGVTDYLDEVHTARHENRPVGAPTGIYWLDRDTGGLHKSNLIVVGARPAMGKTALGLTIALNAAMRGYRAVFVSAEMSSTELGLRLVSMVSGVPGKSLRDADLTESDFTAITAAIIAIKDLPLTIIDKPSCRVSDVAMHTRARALAGGVDLLIVDYLQRLLPDERCENRTREIGRAAAAMKSIARQNNIPVVLMSQVNRGSVARQDKRPTMADLRDSGEIEQEADSVWLLHRPIVYDTAADPETAEIVIDKNRHGPIGLVKCSYRAEIMRWMNAAPHGLENYDEVGDEF